MHVITSNQPDAETRPPLLPDAVLGMLFFLATIVMLFSGLISAYWVARAGASAWPPPLQPRMPIAATAMNTLFLLLSGFTIWQTNRQVKKDHRKALIFLSLTIALGFLFLAAQGNEWVKLIRFGLTTQSSLYGAFFYTIVGVHGFHVFIGILMIISVLYKEVQGKPSPENPSFLPASSIYWYFVVGLWPILYLLVYIL